MTLDHAVVGSAVPPDTGGTTGSDYKLAVHLRSPGEPRLEKFRVSNSSLRLLCWQLSWGGRRSLERGRVCSAVRWRSARGGTCSPSCYVSVLQMGLKTVMPPKTRAKSGGIEPNVLFPSAPKFVSSSQLPTVKSVIGVMRHLTAAKVAHDEAVSTGRSSRRFFFLGGGATWGRVPTSGTSRTENSTDLTHYFLEWTQIYFRKKK